MRSKPAANGRFFLPSDTEPTSGSDVAQRSLVQENADKRRDSEKKLHAARVLVDGVINGERVKLARDPRPLEKGVEVQIRIALAAAGVMVMKHNVDRRATFGTGLGLGVADLICVVPPAGRFLGIEVKRPGYCPSDVRPDQKRWLAVVRRFGGVTGIAASVEEAMALVEEARRG